MSPLDDDEAALVAAYHDTLDLHLHELREIACAIVAARLTKVDDQALLNAYEDYLDDLPDVYVRDMLTQALWHGGRSVEREARTRLATLRDVSDVAILLKEINRA
jgi:hypothetical protein